MNLALPARFSGIGTLEDRSEVFTLADLGHEVQLMAAYIQDLTSVNSYY